MSTDAIANSSSPFKLKIVVPTGQCYSIAVPKSECPIILSAQFHLSNIPCVCGIGNNTSGDAYIIYFYQFQGVVAKEISLGTAIKIYIIYTD